LQKSKGDLNSVIARINRIKENADSSNRQISSQSENLIFRQFISKDIHDLLEAGFPHDYKLKQPLIDRLFERFGVRPLGKGLVAYQTQEKKTIGYLRLIKHRKWLYSIRFVFTNPQFRRMGVASNLLDFAFSRARSEGGKKVFLNVYPDAHTIIDLYSKCGLERISRGYEVWAFADVLKACAPSEIKNKFKALDLKSESSRKRIFTICQNCMGDKWTDFFEIHNNNLSDGFSGEFQRFAFKQVLVDDSLDTCAFIFKRPMTKIAHIEMIAPKDSEFINIFDALILNSHKLHINRLYMKLFNINDDLFISLLKKRGFYKFHSICMGKHL
jgi:ribosomal protein S18 acetylase RimI-like enzyme